MKFRLAIILFITVFLSSAVSAQGALQLQFEINGVSDAVTENINKRLQIEKDAYPKPLSAENIETLYKRAPDIIHEAMQPFGFFNPEIKSKLTHHDNTWTATFNIKRGPALKIGNIDIQIEGPGSDEETLVDYLHNLPLEKNQRFLAETYQEVKEKIFALAQEAGFIKASFTENKVEIDLKENRANIIIHLETGERYYFGRFLFESRDYSAAFLNRFIPQSKIGKPFSSQKLVKYQQSLSNSYYFDSAMVTPDFNHIENYHVPVNVNVIPPKAKRYSLGIGYGTSTGPRFTAGLSLRRLTESGHHFDTQLKLSPIISGIGAKYYIPGANPLTDQWVLSGNFERFNPQNGHSTSGTVAAGYQTKIHSWQTNLNVNYLVEHYKVRDKPNRYSRLLYPSLTLNYVKTDDIINPTLGKSINLVLQGGSKNLLSTTDFLRGEVKAKFLFSPFEKGRFILRGDLGYTVVKDLDDLPLSMRFFAGGLNSIRAFKDSSIGPGKYLTVGSIEYQHQITGNWNGAIFYDAGTASNHFDTPWTQSRGVGIIYQSMVGPIKFYVAQKDKITRNNSHRKKFGVEFSIGPEF